MKKYVLLLLTFFALTCDNGNEFGIDVASLANMQVDDSRIPKSERERFFEDAIMMALMHMGKTNELQNLRIDIPEDTVRIFYAAIVDFYNAGEVDGLSVRTFLDIRPFYPVVTKSLFVTIDSSFQGRQAWFDGTLQTGNPEVDGLLQYCFALSITKLGVPSKKPTFYIELGRHVNTIAVCSVLDKISGVQKADPWVLRGDPDIDMDAWYTADGVYFAYYMDGLMMRDIYTFRITKDHRVTLVGIHRV